MIDNNDLDLVERALREVRDHYPRWSLTAAPSPLVSQVGRVAWRLRHPGQKMLRPYSYAWTRRRLDALAAEGRIEWRRGLSFYEAWNAWARRTVTYHIWTRLPVLTERRTTNA